MPSARGMGTQKLDRGANTADIDSEPGRLRTRSLVAGNQGGVKLARNFRSRHGKLSSATKTVVGCKFSQPLPHAEDGRAQ